MESRFGLEWKIFHGRRRPHSSTPTSIPHPTKAFPSHRFYGSCNLRRQLPPLAAPPLPTPPCLRMSTARANVRMSHASIHLSIRR